MAKRKSDAERGVKPFLIRIPLEVHSRLRVAAAHAGVSERKWEVGAIVGASD